MLSEASEVKKNTEKLKSGQKCSILGPQNLGFGGQAAPPPSPPPLGSASSTVLEILILF